MLYYIGNYISETYIDAKQTLVDNTDELNRYPEYRLQSTDDCGLHNIFRR